MPTVGVPGPCTPKFDTSGRFWVKADGRGSAQGGVDIQHAIGAGHHRPHAGNETRGVSVALGKHRGRFVAYAVTEGEVGAYAKLVLPVEIPRITPPVGLRAARAQGGGVDLAARKIGEVGEVDGAALGAIERLREVLEIGRAHV